MALIPEGLVPTCLGTSPLTRDSDRVSGYERQVSCPAVMAALWVLCPSGAQRPEPGRRPQTHEFVGFRPECPVKELHLVLAAARAARSGPDGRLLMSTDYPQYYDFASRIATNQGASSIGSSNRGAAQCRSIGSGPSSSGGTSPSRGRRDGPRGSGARRRIIELFARNRAATSIG